jgi:ABC-type branched-subunit amino acid transport system permease subunit
MTIAEPRWLLIAYGLNILILVPVCHAMFFGSGTAGVFEGKATDSPALRVMVASLWFSILLASVAGLWMPAAFWPVLAIQIVYKSIWLAAFALPAWQAGAPAPLGVAYAFMVVIAVNAAALWMARG